MTDSLEFLRAILPDSGVYYLVLFKDGQAAPAHKAYTSLEVMATAAMGYDKVPGLSVYHACASYNEPSMIVDGKTVRRKPINWNRAKALWLDIDVGDDKAAKKQGYASKGAAARAVYEFCDRTGFPRPMFVDSGNGIHCYWPMTKAIKPAAWQALSGKLRDVMQHFEVLVDPSRTADFASILRPAGTTNRKRDPKPVVVKTMVPAITPEELRDHLANIVSTYQIASKEITPSYAKIEPGINDDLTSHLTYINMESSARAVADRCMQVARMRDTLGDVSYDHWRGVIGLIKHCTEGIELAREWTVERGNTGHESMDVLTRYETWSAGPSTCDFFAKANPGGCDGCPHRDKIKSPIVLGRIVPDAVVVEVEAVIDGAKMPVQVPKFPTGFKWENSMMVRYLKNKDDIWEAHPFSASLFYPTHRAHKEDGSYCLGMRMHLPDQRTRNFDVNTGLLASPQKLMEELAHSAEIVQTNHKEAAMHITAYLRDSLEQLKSQSEELNTMTSFGWKEDMSSFLIGDRLYHRDGTTKKVLVGGYAADFLNHFPPPHGTIAGYAKGLNHIYAVDGMEPMQYAICSGFGSVLTPFGENLYRGLLVALTGGETARGKSTVCQASLYGWGDANRMTVKTDKGATANARYAQMGTYGNLPLLFDEFTNIEPDKFSELAYNISSGEEKGRLTIGKGGVRKAAQVEWASAPFITANKDLHAILALHTANSQAEAVRMIQIKVDEYDIPQFGDGEVDSALTQMRINAGCAGEALVQHVVTHLDDTFALFQATIARLSPYVPGPKYRFYRNHAAATLTAATILHKLGVIEFNLDRLFVFAVRLMKNLCDSVAESNMITAEDALSYMINDMGPRIITTTGYRDGRDARGPEKVNRLYASVAGRYVLGEPGGKSKEAGKLYLSRKDMREWCMKQRVEISAVLAYAKQHHILVDDNLKFTLTRGTELSTVNIVCVVLDMNKMSDAIPQTLKLVTTGGASTEPPEALVVVQ